MWQECRVPSARSAPKAVENLIASMGERNGDITSLVSIYTLPANWLEERVFVVDGDSSTAFVHPPAHQFLPRPWILLYYADVLRLGGTIPHRRGSFCNPR